MSSIVITINVQHEIPKDEASSVVKSLAEHIFSGTLKDTLEGIIDSATTRGDHAITSINVLVKK